MKTATQRQRKQRLKNEILPDLADLPGWTVVYGKDGATIKHEKGKA